MREEKNYYDFVITDIGYVVERKPNPDWEIEDYSDDRYHILALAVKGKASYKINGNSFEVKKDDLLFFPKGMIHSAHSDQNNPWDFIYVVFDLHFNNNSSKSRLYSMGNIFSGINKFEFSALFTELNHMWTGKKPGYLVRCRSIIMEIMYLMIRETNFSEHNIPHSHQIENIINIMQQNYDKSYSIEKLAERADISPSYFRSLFKKITGLTVIQYKNKIKVFKARDLLLSGECNVTEAAKAVGFDNIYYFSRLFKKITCANPSDYIKR